MNYLALIKSTQKLSLGRFSKVPVVTLISANVNYFTFRANSKYICILNNKDKDNFKVSCDCIDFKYTYAYANYMNKCLEGNKPEPYHKKTNRPSRNPNQYPGLCKHLITCINKLKLKL